MAQSTTAIRFPGGALLREAREGKGLTREASAGHVFRSAETMALYELGKVKPPRRVLVALAGLYGLALADLDPVVDPVGGEAA